MRGPCGFLQVPWDRVYPPVCPLCPSSTPAAPFQAFCRQNPLAGYRPRPAPRAAWAVGLLLVRSRPWILSSRAAGRLGSHRPACGQGIRTLQSSCGIPTSIRVRLPWDTGSPGILLITPCVSSATLKGPPPQISKSRPGWGLPSRARALRVQRQDPTAQSPPAGKPINSPSPSPIPSSPGLHLLQTWSTTAPWGPRRARLPPR